MRGTGDAEDVKGVEGAEGTEDAEDASAEAAEGTECMKRSMERAGAAWVHILM